jgi:catechol 2,3-dioxygenase-like lactoylglutathione lyase family enzyme
LYLIPFFRKNPMPPTFNLKHIIYFCKDMKAMTAFYTDVLGLKIIPHPTFSPDEWVELDAGSFKLCLHYSSSPGSAPGNKNKIVFAVDDVAQARDYLISKKVKMGVHHIWPPMEASDGHDPEGNKFQIAGPHKKSS